MNFLTAVLGDVVEFSELVETRDIEIRLHGATYRGQATRYAVARGFSRLPAALAPWLPPGWEPRSSTEVQMVDALPGRDGPVHSDAWSDSGDVAALGTLSDVEELLVQRHA